MNAQSKYIYVCHYFRYIQYTNIRHVPNKKFLVTLNAKNGLAYLMLSVHMYSGNQKVEILFFMSFGMNWISRNDSPFCPGMDKLFRDF